MPPELISELDKAFAERYSEAADAQLAQFDTLVLKLRLQMNEAKERKSESALALALATFLLLVDQLFTQDSTQLAIVTADYLSMDWPVMRAAVLIDTSELALVSQQVHRLVQDRQVRLEIESQQTGLGVVELAPQSIMGPAEVTMIRKAYDAASSRAVQAAVYNAGAGQIPRKIAIPTIDSRTTNLCRTRMAYQIRAWNEYFTDEVTGASWLYPPFVGGGLPPEESYHYCRSVLLPLGE